MAITKRTITSVDKDVEKLEPSHIDSRNIKEHGCFGRWLQFLRELPCNPTILGIYQTELETCPHKHFYTNVNGAINHNKPKVKTK